MREPPILTSSRSCRPDAPWDPLKPILVSIVIPVYNSEETIDLLCELLITELCSTYRLQIVLVNDGSIDSSADICRELHERHPEVIDCIMLSRNFGEHNAVMAGLNHADGDYCVIMDDDLQNPPSEVCCLIDKIRQGYDVVYTRYDEKKHSFFRNISSALHNKVAVFALGKPADLYLSSFKVISKFVVQEAIRYTGPDPYLDAIILRTTRNIGVVGVKHQSREHGASGYTLLKLISLWGNMIVSFSLYPLRLVGLVGILMVSIGSIVGLLALTRFLIPELADPDGYESINAAMWFFRGIIIFAISVVGEYVGRIYMHLTQAPQFIARQILKRSQDGNSMESRTLVSVSAKSSRS